ncbi:diacylglycerol/lipid kinase family protein [Bdellovibrionota bacterium]
MSETVFIINPTSGAGRSGRVWKELKSKADELFPGSEQFITERKHHATELARKAVKEGAKRIISVGGDGTHHEVVNGLFENRQPINPEIILGTLSMGTGGDFIRTLKISREPEEALNQFKYGRTVKADIGHVEYEEEDGKRGERFFINVCSFGLSALTVNLVNRAPKFLGGKATFFLGAIASMIGYKSKGMQIEIDDQGQIFDDRAVIVAVANGKCFGGGLHISPNSRVDDGKLDLVLVKHLSKPNLMVKFPKVYGGNHIGLPWVKEQKITTLRATPKDKNVFIEADGEEAGKLPCTITCLPSSLWLLVGEEY